VRRFIEDEATGSASTCLQVFQKISRQNSNYQSPGEYINRPSQIYFDGKLTNNDFDINIGGKSQFIAKGEWEV
jgi:trans-2,3-dihydro-3-hydroxyanthranilate isomerase